ncbi:unnamed protein product [Mycena citricolor]|uniref:glutathione transferase n=1 Tax=Mycena citricolor TaxID=2018698 RepID=A0AAD2K218_9AGAR|nr:unnamed protein product [Mycena citricolor]
MRAVDMDEFVPLDTRLRHPPEMFGFAKLVSFVLLATAPIALSTPVPAELAAAIDTSSHCGQYDAVNVGPYTLYLDQWGLGSGVTGSDCASLTSLSGTTIAWKAVWTFNTASGGIKSFTNINVNTGLNKALSAIKTMPSTWKWSQSTSSVVADVAYDLFTANNAGGANVNEIMIWLANFNAGPISASYNAQGQPVAVATNLSIAGHTCMKEPVLRLQRLEQCLLFPSDQRNDHQLQRRFEPLLQVPHGKPGPQYIASSGDSPGWNGGDFRVCYFDDFCIQLGGELVSSCRRINKMVLKLYGYTHSICTRRAALIAKELSVAYELVPVDITIGAQKAPEHLARHPFGLVPTIDDDGFTLFESRAISRYLVAKYGNGSTLVPDTKDIQATAKFEQAMSIENNHFDPLAQSIMVEKVFKAMRGLAPDEAKLSASIDSLNAKLDVYEKILSSQKYLAGSTLTIADLIHLPWLYGLGHAKFDAFTGRPSVTRWYEDISARESWKSVKDGA